MQANRTNELEQTNERTNESVWRLHGALTKNYCTRKGLASSTQCNHQKSCSMPCCAEPHAVENRIGQSKKHSSRSTHFTILAANRRCSQGDHFRLVSISPCLRRLPSFPLSMAYLGLTL